MTTFFVSRHPGAVEWARRTDVPFDILTPHLACTSVCFGDTVIGTLPVQGVAQVCAQGARYLHLSFDMPESMRGRELSADDLELLGARLQEFKAQAMQAHRRSP